MAGYSVTFSVVDHATKEIDAINRRLAAIRAPIERMSKSISRFVDVSGLRKIAQGFDWIGKAALGVLRTLVEIVPVLGTITGAASLAGMAKLVESYAAWSRQLTATADSLGLTTQQVQQFEDAMRLAGGQASDMDAALQGLYKNTTDFIRGQASADTIGWLNRLGINVRDSTGHLRNMSDLMPEVEKKIAAIENPADRAAAAAALLGESGGKVVEGFRQSHIGFDQAMADAKHYQELTDQERAKLEDFSEAQGRIGVTFDHLGQQISATLAAHFTPLINHLAEFVDKHTPEIIAAVDNISAKFAAWLDNITWDDVEAGLKSVTDSLTWVVNHLDDIKVAAEVVAGIFVAKWGVAVVQAIGLVTTALGATGLLGALTAVGALAATVAAALAWADVARRAGKGQATGAELGGVQAEIPPIGSAGETVQDLDRRIAQERAQREGAAPGWAGLGRRFGLMPPSFAQKDLAKLDTTDPIWRWVPAEMQARYPNAPLYRSPPPPPQEYTVTPEGVPVPLGPRASADRPSGNQFAGPGAPTAPVAPATPAAAAVPGGAGAFLASRFAPGGAPAAPAGAPAGAPAAPLGLPTPAPGQAAPQVALPGDTSWGDYGTRANNPGNLNYARWEGAAGQYAYVDPQTGGRHSMAVFNTMQEGIAAQIKLLQRNQQKYGQTIAGALHGYAENPYIGKLGIDPNKPFDIATADPETLAKVLAAQYRIEGRRGSHTATHEQILAGINLSRQPATAVAAAAPTATVPPPAGTINGSVDVNITHRNPPPDAAVTARGSGAVNVPPPRVEYQNLNTA